MKYKLSGLIPVILLTCVTAFTQTTTSTTNSNHVLRNNDVLLMVQDGVKPGEIIAKIVTSPCQFDIFPPVLHDLKQRGVPDAVLLAMKTVPVGRPAQNLNGAAELETALVTRRVRIPSGTVINVEALKHVSSADVDKGSPIQFLVSRRVVVDKAVAIDHGALVEGRIIKRNRPGFFGRGGSLEFALENVVAVDGTRVPVQLSKGAKQKGSNHTSAVTAGAVITGAIVFPYTAPVGLIWALKKGDEAVLEQGTRLTAIVKKNQEVAGLPTERKTIYHSATLDQTPVQSTGFKGTGNQSFRPTSIKQ